RDPGAVAKLSECVESPAPGRVVGADGASVIEARAYRLPRRWPGRDVDRRRSRIRAERAITQFAVVVMTPTPGRVVGPDGAGVFLAGADRLPFVGDRAGRVDDRWRGVEGVDRCVPEHSVLPIGAPAPGGVVGPDGAGVVRAGTDGFPRVGDRARRVDRHRRQLRRLGAVAIAQLTNGVAAPAPRRVVSRDGTGVLGSG